MANTKITALSSASLPLSGSEFVPVVQAGINSQVSITNILSSTNMTFQNISTIETTSIPAAIQSVQVLSYASPGDLRGHTITLSRVSSCYSTTNPSQCGTPSPVTITLGTPGILTFTGYWTFTPGMAISFTSTGTLPTGITSGVIYYVSADAHFAVNGVFAIADTYAHAMAGTNSIALSGSPTGTMTGFLPYNIMWNDGLYGGSPPLALVPGNGVVFTGTNIPAQITAEVTYYILPQAFGENNFQISTTINGSPIVFTTQTYGDFNIVASSFPGFVRSTDTYLPNGSMDSTNGGWWQVSNEEITPQMFGAPTVGDSGHDDYSAIFNMFNYGYALAYKGFNAKVAFPAGTYYSSQTITVNYPCHISGPNFFQGVRTKINFPAGVGGFVFSSGIGSSTFKGIKLQGTLDLTYVYPAAIGILCLAPCELDNLTVVNFSGHGIALIGDTTHTNVDNTSVRNCMSSFNGYNGFLLLNADANVITLINCSTTNNGWYGYWNQGYYTNTFICCHESYNGHPEVVGGATNSLGPFCTYSSKLWQAVPGGIFWPATGTSTFTSYGTTTPGTDTSVWIDTGLPSSSAPYMTPAWTNTGQLFSPGGGNLSWGSGLFLNCYQESGAGWNWLSSSDLSVSGMVGAGYNGTGSQIGGNLENQIGMDQILLSGYLNNDPTQELVTYQLGARTGIYFDSVTGSISGEFAKTFNSGGILEVVGGGSGQQIGYTFGWYPSNKAMFNTADDQKCVHVYQRLGLLSNGGSFFPYGIIMDCGQLSPALDAGMIFRSIQLLMAKVFLG